MNKFQITQVTDKIIVEVYKGNTMILTRVFPVSLEIDLEDIKRKLRSEAELF